MALALGAKTTSPDADTPLGEAMGLAAGLRRALWVLGWSP